MIKGLTYIPNYISERMQKLFVEKIDEQKWSNELKRRVQHYGYKYNYTFKKIDSSMKVQDMLNWMVLLSRTMVFQGYFERRADQAIVNEYEPGQGINKHVDCVPCFNNSIASLSLLSPVVMEFTSRHTGEIRELILEPRSLLLLNDEARYEWLHGIPARKKDGDVERSRRISVTFRNVILS